MCSVVKNIQVILWEAKRLSECSHAWLSSENLNGLETGLLWSPETCVHSHVGRLLSRDWKLVYYFVCVVNWLAMLSLWQKDTDGKILAVLKSVGKLPCTRSSGSSPTLAPQPQSLLSLAAGIETSHHNFSKTPCESLLLVMVGESPAAMSFLNLPNSPMQAECLMMPGGSTPLPLFFLYTWLFNMQIRKRS